MIKRFAALMLILLIGFSASAQNLQSPDEFLGYELGSRFTPHYKVLDYFQYVASQLSNVKTQEYGQTNELRTLMVAYISSQENIDNWEQIRTDNLKRTGALTGAPEGEKKGIVWLSYNVHGNEASGMEASMKTLYELVRPDNAKAKEWLQNTVIIMDPCINPDGRDRYSNWINQVAGTTANPSREAKEHDSPWPGGRANHYLFDLNRDWAWQKQVESQQRMALYNTIMPHIHVDFHEQGSNSPYYFAPAAEPVHEIVTDWQRTYQDMIGRNHAKYFDENGWLFFTKENFDILYPSYGDSYPMYNGAIGMTYEQASSDLAILTDEGDTLTLKDALTHHHTTGMSTVEVASVNSERMVDEFTKYFADAANNPSSKYKSYVIKGSNHGDKMDMLRSFLDRHQIRYGSGSTRKAVSAFAYQTGETSNVSVEAGDLVISAYQPKSRLVQALFEPNTYASTEDTYDITAWAMPYLYDLDAYATEAQIEVDERAQFETVEGKDLSTEAKPAAYLVKWESMKSAKFLSAILKAGIKLRFATTPFSVNGNDFDNGTLILTRKGNMHIGDDFDQTIKAAAEQFDRDLYSTPTTFVDNGKDFGSNNVPFLEAPKVLVLRGEGVSSLGFGEFWYYMEQELNYPLTMVDADNLGRVNLDKYNVIVMPSGSYGRALGSSTMESLNAWVRSGGRVIAIDRAINTFAGQDGFELKRKSSEDDETEEEKEANALTPYADRRSRFDDYRLPGAIFKLKVDNTHPLGFGYSDHYFTLKNNGTAFEYLSNGWNVGTIPSADAHVAGVAGDKVKEQLAKSVVFGVENKGGGAIIYMADNPLFRAFWENGKLLVANALFLVGQ